MRRVFSNALWARVKGVIPQKARDAFVIFVLFSDRASRKAFRESQRFPGHGVVSVRLRRLGGMAVEIRRGSDDPWALREAFTWSDQLPPPALDPRFIVDLGANIGASMALFAVRFSDAQILGIEPDPENAELCRRNVAAWGSRCQVLQAAAWSVDGTVRIAGDTSSTYNVQEYGREVDSISLSRLVEQYGAIDYLKVDIEGAEQELLTHNTGWTTSVACVNVEVHAPYSIESCVDDLTRLGFSATLRAAPRQPHVIGLRHSATFR
jgi:FkbM family methyltransferase